MVPFSLDFIPEIFQNKYPSMIVAFYFSPKYKVGWDEKALFAHFPNSSLTAVSCSSLRTIHKPQYQMNVA